MEIYISRSVVGYKAPAKSVANSICPYSKVHSMYCSASIMRMPIDQRRNMTYCSTNDFDCCPVYLAKVFRAH